jgi:hypothetical protein
LIKINNQTDKDSTFFDLDQKNPDKDEPIDKDVPIIIRVKTTLKGMNAYG